MILRYISTFFLFILTYSLIGQVESFSDKELSDSSRISLLTVSPGKDLYSAFGHTGIRITDYKNNFDIVFNYGTFDFNQSGFYVNFVKGKMRYMISTNKFDDFIYAYGYEMRSITEQQLNLTVDDKQRIFAFLYNNALPENRSYLYDFFWDNCSTRPRDVFEKTLGDRIEFHTDNIDFQKSKTMHDMLRLYIGNRPWVDYGFDLVLGMPCEKIASPRDQTFLPDYLAKYIDCASIDGKPFVLKQEFLLQFPLPKIEQFFVPLYLNLIFVFLTLMIWIIEQKRQVHFYVFDFGLFLMVGLLGIFFLSLWLFTSHQSVRENLNLLWLIPLHAIVAFLLLRNKKPAWLKYYFTGTCILMILLLICWNCLPQQFNISIIPILLLLSFRSATIVVHLQSRLKINT